MSTVRTSTRLVGLAQPGKFGADVSHLNLHKTFCIPHGGGGPGVGPVAVRAHLAPYLPNHPLHAEAGPDTGIGPVSAAPWGIGGHPADLVGLHPADGRRGPHRARRRSRSCHANYIAHRLAPHYPVLYTGRGGLVAHECILDLRAITKETGVTVDDVAKRLIDYGFHAPDDVVPGRRHADGRADRVRGPRRDRPVLRRDDRDPRRDRPGRVRGVAGLGQPAAQRPAHGGVGRWRRGSTRTRASVAAFPVAAVRRRQVLAAGAAHRRRATATATWSAAVRRRRRSRRCTSRRSNRAEPASGTGMTRCRDEQDRVGGRGVPRAPVPAGRDHRGLRRARGGRRPGRPVAAASGARQRGRADPAPRAAAGRLPRVSTASPPPTTPSSRSASTSVRARCADALTGAGLAAADVDLLMTATVTGLAAPSLDARLVARSGCARTSSGCRCSGSAASPARPASPGCTTTSSATRTTSPCCCRSSCAR